MISTQIYYHTDFISKLDVCFTLKYTIDYFQNNSDWKPSLGEELGMIHYRNGHDHAVCDPKTGICEVHYDEIDPYESLTSLIKHMAQSNTGKAVLITAGGLVLDQLLTGGQVRKSIMKYQEY